jgi:uncharacterized protein
MPPVKPEDIETLPPAAFHMMTKPRGAICNLDCKYCYFLSKERLYPGGSFRMPDEVLESYTRQYIQAQRGPEVTFAWQGGEPALMGLDFYRQAVAYQQKYRKPGMKINNTFQTNGLLLDADWAAFFRRHGFLVGISLDGPQPYHDAYRVDKGGGPTHARVLKSLQVLKAHEVDFNVLCCVHAANAGHPLEVYRFLRDEAGAQFVQFIPIVELANQTGFQEGFKVTRRSVGGRKYGAFLIEVFDEWVRRDVGKVFVQMFEIALSVWLGGRAGLCVFEETCGEDLALEHNGDLYSCDHYVEPRFFLGNIQERDLIELVPSPEQVAFGQAKRDRLPRYCRECEVRFICNGGCPKDRVRRTPDGEAGLNYLCEGYKSFFKHIDEPMKLMAGLLRAGRPASEIVARNAGSRMGGSSSRKKKNR